MKIPFKQISGVVPVAQGGTNITSYTVGDLIYASGATTLSKLADVAAGQVLTSGGVGVAPVWAAPVTSATAWQLLGNSGTVAGTNFIGTIDAIDFVVKTTNTERLRVLSTGNVGIGTASPTLARLQVAGAAASLGLYVSGLNTTYGAGQFYRLVASANTEQTVLTITRDTNAIQPLAEIGATMLYEVPLYSSDDGFATLTSVVKTSGVWVVNDSFTFTPPAASSFDIQTYAVGTLARLVRFGGNKVAIFSPQGISGINRLTASTENIDVDFQLNRTVTFATGALVTQRAFVITPPTYAFQTASTLTTSSSFVVTAAPTAGTNATITNSFAGQFGGTVTLGATSAGMIYRAINVPTHTVTVTGSTAVTSVGFAGIGIGRITITDASAVTYSNASSLYISNSPVAAGSVTLAAGNTYSIWVDDGIVRLDGDLGVGTTTTSVSGFGSVFASTTSETLLAIRNVRIGVMGATLTPRIIFEDISPSATQWEIDNQLGIFRAYYGTGGAGTTYFNIVGLAASAAAQTGFVALGNVSATARLHFAGAANGGNVSVNAWTTNGVGIRVDNATYTDLTSVAGTIASSYIHNLSSPTFAATNVITITRAATLFVGNPQTGGANVTYTNRHAAIFGGSLWFSGALGAITFSDNLGVGRTIETDIGTSGFTSNPLTIRGGAGAVNAVTQNDGANLSLIGGAGNTGAGTGLGGNVVITGGLGTGQVGGNINIAGGVGSVAGYVTINSLTRIGSIVAPTVQLDVTGDILASLTIKSSGATAGIGYATGAGGTVTQITSKATGVTLNTICGQITMNGAALAAAAEVSFVVTNSACATTDVPIVAIDSVGTVGAYTVTVSAVGAGSFTITLGNVSAGSLSEAVVLNFAIIKATTS
jgi:hypothetical protein